MMNGICPECGAEALAAEQRFCQHCGGAMTLPHPTVPATGNIVDDGSERAMSTLVWQSGLEWVETHRGHLALYGAGAVVAVFAAAVALVVLASLAFAALVTLGPFLFVALLVLAASRNPRRRRHYRGHARHYRHWI